MPNLTAFWVDRNNQLPQLIHVSNLVPNLRWEIVKIMFRITIHKQKSINNEEKKLTLMTSVTLTQPSKGVLFPVDIHIRAFKVSHGLAARSLLNELQTR